MTREDSLLVAMTAPLDFGASELIILNEFIALA
jgi:hypothetical protein